MNFRINKKVKAGFTIIELLVVLAISGILMATLGSGILNMQSAVKLDNTIRDFKIEIQTAQSQARNSFLTADRSNPLNITDNFFQNGNPKNNISLGWMITFQNDPSNSKTINIIRQSVFFKPEGSYNFDRLRDEIINFRAYLIRKLSSTDSEKFECTSNGIFNIKGVSLSSGMAYTSVTGSNIAIKCADKFNYSNSEYFENSSGTVRLSTKFGVNPLPSCWESDTPGSQKSMFFTSGYGEPVLNVDLINGNRVMDCQLQIQYTVISSGDVRALKVSKDNGNVELCGAYCGI